MQYLAEPATVIAPPIPANYPDLPPARPNTIPKFDICKHHVPLPPASTPLHPEAWLWRLALYPGKLGLVLHHIASYGCDIGVVDEIKPRISRNHKIQPDAEEVITSKIATDLASHRIHPVDPALRHTIVSSPLGLVPKHDGGWRRIHDLSYPEDESVNDAISADSAAISYVLFDTLTDRIMHAGRGCTIIKRDIKDAFRMVPVALALRHLLAFSWAGVVYTEACLPFGLATAPFIFNLFAEGLHWMLTALLGDILEHYLDDFIFILAHGSLTTIADISATWIALTDELGVPRNDSKDVEGTEVELLGITVNTITMKAWLSPKKLQQAIQQITNTLDKKGMSFADAKQLGGRLAWCAKVVYAGRAFTSSLWKFLAAFPNQRVIRRIPIDLRRDLEWWLYALQTGSGVRILDPSLRTVHLFTDASNIGLSALWYACDEPHFIAKPELVMPLQWFAFPRHDSDHINVAEVTAILMAFEMYGHWWTNHKVVIHTDNVTAYEGFNRGRLRGAANFPLREALLLAIHHQFNIESTWLASKENALADALSRFDTNAAANSCQTLALMFATTANSPTGEPYTTTLHSTGLC